MAFKRPSVRFRLGPPSEKRKLRRGGVFAFRAGRNIRFFQDAPLVGKQAKTQVGKRISQTSAEEIEDRSTYAREKGGQDGVKGWIRPRKK